MFFLRILLLKLLKTIQIQTFSAKWSVPQVKQHVSSLHHLMFRLSDGADNNDDDDSNSYLFWFTILSETAICEDYEI